MLTSNSIGYELHDRHQRLRLGRLYDVLLPLREEVVYGA